MKKLLMRFVSVCIWSLTIAQQKDAAIISPMQAFFEVRLNPKDTAFRNTKFALPPTSFILDNSAPLKTKSEVDSITYLINKMQQEIITRNQQLQYNSKKDFLKNGSAK